MLRLSCLGQLLKNIAHERLQYHRSLTHTTTKMFSLIRKISNSQQPKEDNMEQQAKTDDEDTHEAKQQEEVDGTTYDPRADPRDPGRYYTFPHFAEE
jgi:septal ring factor EnvC (AmiA/AmiB activator)